MSFENKNYEDEILLLKEKLKNHQTVIRELEVLNEIALMTANSADIDQTLYSIVQILIKAINAEQGSVLLCTDNNEVFKTLIRQEMVSHLKTQYNIRKSITGWVLFHKESLLILNLAEDTRFNATEDEKKDIHTVICTPIWFEGNIIGTLLMINKENNSGGSFNEDELRLLTMISVQAGQLIKNSQMQQEALQKKREAERARLETEKLQELDRLKTNFFNNISHEFRTPITLIVGPAEKIINESSDEKAVKEAALIKKYSNRLLQLINELLELSKLEAGKLKLNAAKYNIVSFIKGIVLSFESLAEDKDINLIFLSNKDFIEIYFDIEKMTKILSNLLSNAFKFTPEEGEISVTISECVYEGSSAAVQIKVRDNGIGIPKEELDNLFDRFYQVNSSFSKKNGGTGIGLSLTRELVELHHGKISVESYCRIKDVSDNHLSSKDSGWTEFTFFIPAGRAHLSDDEISDENTILNFDKILPPDHNNNEFDDLTKDISVNKTIILIVEDNYDMRKYIKDSLKKDFYIVEAISGEQAVRKAQKIIPDLIISDMMMPGMDGNELTKIIKHDERTSHIPVILLTAKSAPESKLEGLKTGADEYITKPFDLKELKIRIENLISIRKTLRKKYQNEIPNSKAKDTPIQKPDNSLRRIDMQFLKKAQNIVEENLADEDFSIEEFGIKVGMSRTQLHRKLKAITGKSPSLYLRSLRLKKAKNMLEEDQGNVSEVAYSVGFSSPAYFTSCFKEEFGFLPSDLI